MSLQIRRGTNAERLTITPRVGELIYVTDHITENAAPLWVGDGVTPGGNPAISEVDVGSLNDLEDVNVVGATDGQVLGYDSIQDIWNPIDIGVAGSGIVEGSNYRINIAADDSTILVDTSTGEFNGNLTGSVFGDDSTTLVDAVNNKIVGDIQSVAGNFTNTVTADAFVSNFGVIDDLTSLAFNLGTGSITDVTIIDGEMDGIFRGTGDGDFSGQFRGSVFTDGSTQLIDGTSGDFSGRNALFDTVKTPILLPISNKIIMQSELSATSTNFSIASTDARSNLVLEYQSDNPLQGNDIAHGAIAFRRNGSEGELTSSFIFGGESGVLIANDPAGNYTSDKFVSIKNGQLIIGGFIPNAELDVQGSAIVSGSVTASVFNGDIIGSLFTDSSTMLIDSTDGKLMVANVNIVGETGNTPATPGSVDSWLEVTVNGASKYIPLYV